jgi:hypothetical protein
MGRTGKAADPERINADASSGNVARGTGQPATSSVGKTGGPSDCELALYRGSVAMPELRG